MESFLKHDTDTDTKGFASIKENVEWKYILRQVFIASGAWSIYFTTGMQFGAPTVIVPQLRRANITVTEEMASWLSSTFSYGAIPWIFILAAMVRGIGRRKTFFFISLTTVLSCIGLFFSTNPTHLLIVEAGFAIAQGALGSILILILTEYTSPEYRGMFLSLKSASYAWGIWVSNAIGTFTTWKYISIVAFFISLHALTAFFWPESPYWLASKYKFAECKKAHVWLKGKRKDAQHELDILLQAKTDESIAFKDLSRREFLMPLFVCILALMQYHVSGKFVITIHAIDIMKKITEDESTVYASMLILDGITVFSAYVGCVLVKLYKRRIILLVTGIAGTMFLLILSLYQYLVAKSVLSENVYLSIFFLGGFSLAFSSGPYILSTSLYGEIIPSRYKSITVVIIGTEHVILLGTMAKLAPLCMNMLGLHGLFLLYALLSGIVLCLLYYFLPETKDKTLLEIQEHFKARPRQ